MPYEMQVLIDEEVGEWRSLKPAMPDLAPPYRYLYRQDAVLMLNKLRPDLPSHRKRVVEVK